jgi:hypothetical protein
MEITALSAVSGSRLNNSVTEVSTPSDPGSFLIPRAINEPDTKEGVMGKPPNKKVVRVDEQRQDEYGGRGTNTDAGTVSPTTSQIIKDPGTGNQGGNGDPKQRPGSKPST